MMNILNRLFSNNDKSGPSLLNPRSFLDCMSVIHECSIHAIVDPDYLIASDPNFMAAMDAVVTCPYCSNKIIFGNAIKSQGINLTVECPECHATPSIRANHYEYDHA